MTRFLQPGSNDDLLIVTLPEPKRIDPVPRELPPLCKRLSTSDQDFATTDHQRESESPITPGFAKSFCKEEADGSPDGPPKLHRQKTIDRSGERDHVDPDKVLKGEASHDGPSRKLSRSLRNFGVVTKEGDQKDPGAQPVQPVVSDSRPAGETPVSEVHQGTFTNIAANNLVVNVTSVKMINSHSMVPSSRMSRAGGQGHSTNNIEEQRKKKDKMTMIEDMKLEVYENELHIINNSNEEVIPLESLKVSTIHDISKNIQDKFHMDTLDQDEQFLLESKLGNFSLTEEALCVSKSWQPTARRTRTRDRPSERPGTPNLLTTLPRRCCSKLLSTQKKTC